ncbi:type IV secretion system protein [Sphingomonas sp. GM_Shp_2]|uniref:type IV secretion system protein n=1 Tax=Sphingomonas sp. GM_Shp_2 TaxID=2937380 RepID=UPI002269F1DA|nr:type IV secretion system protein [Sphingomonas sp. GM_Shp_2]
MRMMCTLIAFATSTAVVAFAAPASAQGIPVFDTTTYLQALQTARQTLTIVDQGRQQIQTASSQLQSLRKLTDTSEIASALNLPQVRNILPISKSDLSAIASGDIAKLGTIGTIASNIQSRYAMRPTGSDADTAYAQALKDSTGSAATTAALGQNTLAVAQTRTEGLDLLRQRLAQARDPKDVMDLQARIGVEQAQLQNDMLKMQAIQMAQAGEANLAISAARLSASRNDAAFFRANSTRK